MKNCNKIKLLLAHLRDLLIVVLIGNAVSFLFSMEFINFWERVWINSIYSLFIGGTLWKGNQFIGWWVHRKIDGIKEPYKALSWSLGLMFVFSLVDIMIVNYIWFVVIYDWTIQRLFSNGLLTMIIELAITVVITSILFASGFFRSWRESAVNEERLEKESIRLQYNALKNQVNPHFLFNSLNTLTTLVYKDADQAARFIKQLSEVYRYVLEHKDSELVSLEEELTFCHHYIFLQKIRHGQNLKVEINLYPDQSIRIVPLSIQLLLENAIKHNEVSTENPLRIKVEKDQDYILVTNNLQPRSVIPDSGGIGLDTLRKRYDFLSEKKLSTEETNGSFIVYIPIIRK
jgi:sensor histidine kinase YesM